jgi:acyl-CoA thioesterase-1
MRSTNIGTANSMLFAALCFAAVLSFSRADAASGTIVALGASNTYGKGVARNRAYPAQLEAILRAKGHTVRVINAGINGNTTRQMLARLDSAVPNGVSLVILQPGGNDRRKGEGGDSGQNIAEIQSRLSARGVRLVMMENGMFRGLPKQPDGQHMTPEGYRMLAEAIASQAEGSLGR